MKMLNNIEVELNCKKAWLIKKYVQKDAFKYFWNVATSKKPRDSFYEIDTTTYRVKHASPLSAIPTKWSNTLKQFPGNLPTNFLSVFDDFAKSALKRLEYESSILPLYRKIRVTESLCSGIFYAMIDLIYHWIRKHL